jgi:hypothetical protein
LTCQISTPCWIAWLTWALTVAWCRLGWTWKPGLSYRKQISRIARWWAARLVSELADVADKPVGGVQRRAWPRLDVAAEGDLEVVERGFDLDVGVVVDQEVQPRVAEDLFAAEGVGGDHGRQHVVGEGLFDEAVRGVLVDPDPGGCAGAGRVDGDGFHGVRGGAGAVVAGRQQAGQAVEDQGARDRYRPRC